MNAYKKLLKNSGVFAIANLGSKLISIILVPYYTYVLSTAEYGTIDIITTNVSLILPLITLNIFDATLRFSVKSKYNNKDIFSSSIIVIILGNLIFLLGYPFLNRIVLLKNIAYLFYIIIFIQSINCVIAQFARGIGKVKEFAANGVINTFVLVISNIILLSKFKLGIKGYLISIILAYSISTIYLIISVRIWRFYSPKKINSKLIKEMTIYSIPLIPNSLMWWVMNASDRYAITMFLGIAANGIYAVAYKIPTVLNLLYSIFSQAWQLSAIEEGDSENKSEFYTNVFKILSIVMLLGTSFIIMIVRPVIEIVLSTEYKDSWKYVPFLLLAVVFTSFSSFLGTNYIAMKETKGVFKTSLVGAILNIILNLILIPLIGINGAAIATMISFAIVWIIRIYDTKKFVMIKIDLKKLIYSLIIISLQICILYMKIKYYLIIEVILVILILIVNKSDLFNIINQVIMLIKRKG